LAREASCRSGSRGCASACAADQQTRINPRRTRPGDQTSGRHNDRIGQGRVATGRGLRGLMSYDYGSVQHPVALLRSVAGQQAGEVGSLSELAHLRLHSDLTLALVQLGDPATRKRSPSSSWATSSTGTAGRAPGPQHGIRERHGRASASERVEVSSSRLPPPRSASRPPRRPGRGRRGRRRAGASAVERQDREHGIRVLQGRDQRRCEPGRRPGPGRCAAAIVTELVEVAAAGPAGAVRAPRPRAAAIDRPPRAPRTPAAPGRRPARAPRSSARTASMASAEAPWPRQRQRPGRGCRRPPASRPSSWATSPASTERHTPQGARRLEPRAAAQVASAAARAWAKVGYSSSSSSIRRNARRRALGSAPERRSASAASSSAATGSATACSGSAASRCTPLRSNAFPVPSTSLSARDSVTGAQSSASSLELPLPKQMRSTTLQ